MRRFSDALESSFAILPGEARTIRFLSACLQPNRYLPFSTISAVFYHICESVGSPLKTIDCDDFM
jgi:hypothetical protein